MKIKLLENNKIIEGKKVVVDQLGNVIAIVV